MDLAAKPFVMAMEGRTNDALGPVKPRRFDSEDPAALLQHGSQLRQITTVGNGMIPQPTRQILTIGNGCLTEAEVSTDFGTVAFDSAVRGRHHLGRRQLNAEL